MKIVRGPHDTGSVFWYTYDQNNSGGTFTYDEGFGVSTKVLIQARDYREANRIAQGIGLYFGGDGDCSCCGSRWYEKWDNTGCTDEPMIYGVPIAEYVPDRFNRKWMDEGQFEYFAHYLDGTIVGYRDTDKNYIDGEIVTPTKELEA